MHQAVWPTRPVARLVKPWRRARRAQCAACRPPSAAAPIADQPSIRSRRSSTSHVRRAPPLNTIDVQEMGGGLSVSFPFSSADGMTATATVLQVYEPGGALPEHTDSAEEWLLVLEGTFEATVGDQTVTISEGELAFVPALVPHSGVNIGDGTCRGAASADRRTSRTSPSRSAAPAARRRSSSVPPPGSPSRSPCPSPPSWRRATAVPDERAGRRPHGRGGRRPAPRRSR